MFEKKIRRRNFIEYAAGAVIIAVFGWVGWLTFTEGEYFISLSWLSMIVGTVIVMLNLRRVGSLLPHNPEVDCNSHLRAQMAHQHRALSTVGRWYIGPVLPGVALVLIAMAEFTARTTGWPIALGGLMGPALMVTGLNLGVLWLNKRAARELVKQIEELDRLAADNLA